eukprot:scaffold169390_cov31-Tisochrysis_lutea.AAC.5
MSYSVVVFSLLAALTGPAARPNIDRPEILTRRFALVSAVSVLSLVPALRPVHAGTLPGVSPSKLLTIGEYLNDIRSARAGVLGLTPLLETGQQGYERARVELRKPPSNGIRKAATKILLQLEGTELYEVKIAQYDKIKTSLAALDDGCRPSSGTQPAAMVGEAEKLAALLQEFGEGFPVKDAMP